MKGLFITGTNTDIGKTLWSAYLLARSRGIYWKPIQCGKPYDSAPNNTGRLWIVEGAGGVLVPLNDTHMMVDMISMMCLPVIIVASTRLGTINHTLLTIEALRTRHVFPRGVVLYGEQDEDNHHAIEHYGNIKVLSTMCVHKPIRHITDQDVHITHHMPSWWTL
ncbi:MAG: dethiobiotin synthase [Alphaproteobacteria bacterium GM7ARS4]|nr:dethiobiotin synthase [Alphaproteobacteria bacterium GM7ARS4]